MANYNNIYKPLIVGRLNEDYEKVYNCRVIDPTYEKGLGLHNQEFFLDKRLGMTEFHKGDFHFTDDIKIDGLNYYLYNDENNIYVGVEELNGIKQIAGPFNRNSKSPLRFAQGRGAKGICKEENLTINNAVTLDNNNIIQNENGIYEDGYIVLDVGRGKNIKVGDYVVFKDNVFAGATVEIDLYQNGKIYILGINQRGSIPINGTIIDIYSNKGKIPVIGTSDGVLALHINGVNNCKNTNILSGDIEDVISFNESLFALKENIIYFSTKTVDDNLQFYSSSDRKFIEGAYKLVSKGKFLIVFADDNRLVSPITESSINSFQDYSFYPLNYNGRLYSKYSYIFVNSSLYIVQSDKQIVNANISSLNATAFNFDTNSITQTIRGLMSDIDDYNSDDKGEIFSNSDYNNTQIHFFYQKKDNTTIEYEYDSQYKHWILHTYEHRVYKKTDKWLCKGYINNIGGYKDLGKEYKQDINFFIDNKGEHLLLGFNDMIMGLIKGEKLEYNFEVDCESLHGLKKYSKTIKYNTFDTLPSDHSLYFMRIAKSGKGNQHYGTVTSIRRIVGETSRYFRCSINGYKRFIYGSSLLFYKKGNPFVHEIENSF